VNKGLGETPRKRRPIINELANHGRGDQKFSTWLLACGFPKLNHPSLAQQDKGGDSISSGRSDDAMLAIRLRRLFYAPMGRRGEDTRGLRITGGVERIRLDDDIKLLVGRTEFRCSAASDQSDPDGKRTSRAVQRGGGLAHKSTTQ